MWNRNFIIFFIFCCSFSSSSYPQFGHSGPSEATDLRPVGNLAHADPLQNHLQVKTKDVVTLQQRSENEQNPLHHNGSTAPPFELEWDDGMGTSSTHHQHVGVDFVHLGQEEAEQSALCRSNLHFTVLTEEGQIQRDSTSDNKSLVALCELISHHRYECH